MSNSIQQRSKKLAERWAKETDSRHKFAQSSSRLQNTMNNTNATISSTIRQEPQMFKMPVVPLRHTTQLRPHNTLNSTISQSSMKYLLENNRKSFLKCLESHILDFELNTIQNEEQALLMYTALNRIVCDAMSSSSSERNDESRLRRLFDDFAKALESLLKPCNGRGPMSTTSSQHADLESQVDPTEFDQAAFHSTQIEIGNNLEEPNHKYAESVVSIASSSRSAAPKSNFSFLHKYTQQRNQNKEREPEKPMYSHIFKNYTSTGTEQLLGESSANTGFQTLDTNSGRFSPDLGRSRIARSKSDRNVSKINAARLKESLTRKLDSTMSMPCTSITNWFIKTHDDKKIELFGSDSSSMSTRCVSHGIVRARKGDFLLRTDKGMFRLFGRMKKKTDLPPLVRQKFENDFPFAWKKTLNESGIWK